MFARGIQKMDLDGFDNCKLCFDPFDEKATRPRVLSCGHSYCTTCLNNLIENGELVCPSCKQRHRTADSSDFPINYALEESILYSKRPHSSIISSRDRFSAKSKRMKSMIDEQKRSAESLLTASHEFQSQMNEYNELLIAKRKKHEGFRPKINTFLQKIRDLANENELVIRQIDDERNELGSMQKVVEGLKKGVKDELPNLDSASSAKRGVAIAELDQSVAELEDWKESCQNNFPNPKIITSSKKVTGTMATLCMCDGDWDKKPANIPDLSSTDFTILEKVNMIEGNNTITIEKLRTMSDPLKKLIRDGRVYAVQTDKRHIRSAKLSYENGKLYLHCLEDGEPPAHALTIKQRDLTDMLQTEKTQVFLELGWDGMLQGRVNITLSPATTFLAQQFRTLCTGDLGPSYVHSRFFGVEGNAQHWECIRGGDYEANDGSGGASLLKGFEEDQNLYKRPMMSGIVSCPRSVTEGPESAQFTILTGCGDSSKTYNGVFGQVEDGLQVIRSAIDTIDGDVRIRDCGVMVPL